MIFQNYAIVILFSLNKISSKIPLCLIYIAEKVEDVFIIALILSVVEDKLHPSLRNDGGNFNQRVLLNLKLR